MCGRLNVSYCAVLSPGTVSFSIFYKLKLGFFFLILAEIERLREKPVKESGLNR